jgi:hypothetical protein
MACTNTRSERQRIRVWNGQSGICRYLPTPRKPEIAEQVAISPVPHPARFARPSPSFHLANPRRSPLTPRDDVTRPHRTDQHKRQLPSWDWWLFDSIRSYARLPYGSLYARYGRILAPAGLREPVPTTAQPKNAGTQVPISSAPSWGYGINPLLGPFLLPWWGIRLGRLRVGYVLTA